MKNNRIKYYLIAVIAIGLIVIYSFYQSSLTNIINELKAKDFIDEVIYEMKIDDGYILVYSDANAEDEIKALVIEKGLFSSSVSHRSASVITRDNPRAKNVDNRTYQCFITYSNHPYKYLGLASSLDDSVDHIEISGERMQKFTYLDADYFVSIGKEEFESDDIVVYDVNHNKLSDFKDVK